ncbi:uncharacterized protein N7459_009905 [Penicillium hispanicum]|uniref:uncharacterized protein n=1 Tax=Penicillium hispanicum TaxID=1080232 RepID=UPI002540C2A9|nr:uncharacterized protein N7459_009905 [Penicillium hispanicum]KAJ5570475.1 hypothetical protein N7459_009905 [Penicillium hispanicum]
MDVYDTTNSDHYPQRVEAEFIRPNLDRADKLVPELVPSRPYRHTAIAMQRDMEHHDHSLASPLLLTPMVGDEGASRPRRWERGHPLRRANRYEDQASHCLFLATTTGNPINCCSGRIRASRVVNTAVASPPGADARSLTG